MQQLDPRQILDDWLTTTPYSPVTRRKYREAVSRWLDWIGPRVWHATPREVDAWAGPPGRTRAHRVSVVRSFYTHTMDRYRAPAANPALRSLRGSVEGLPGREALTRTQTAALVQASEHATGPLAARDRAMVYLTLGMGLRPGQLVGLLMEHLHPDDQNGPSLEVPQKGGGTRLEPLPGLVWPVVRDYLPHRRYTPPHAYQHTGALLTTHTGRPLDPHTNPAKILRRVAAGHDLLKDVEITPDGLARSTLPW